MYLRPPFSLFGERALRSSSRATSLTAAPAGCCRRELPFLLSRLTARPAKRCISMCFSHLGVFFFFNFGKTIDHRKYRKKCTVHRKFVKIQYRKFLSKYFYHAQTKLPKAYKWFFSETCEIDMSGKRITRKWFISSLENFSKNSSPIAILEEKHKISKWWSFRSVTGIYP